MVDIEDFFEKVDRRNGGDGLIWVKASAPKGGQVVVDVKNRQGHSIKIPALKPGDPICLSRFAPFDLIRESHDLTQCVASGLVKIMSSAEANAYFEKKAKLLKTSPKALIDKVNQDAKDQLNSKPLAASEVDLDSAIGIETAEIEDVVQGRVLNVCSHISPMLKESERWPVSKALEELLELEDSLTLEDCDYLASQGGVYPSIVKWANEKMREIGQASGVFPESDALSD